MSPRWRRRRDVALDTKTDRCWVCGPGNPAGLKVTFEPVGDNGSRARYVARDEHGGWPGVLHGGVLLALMDEAPGWSLYFHGPGGMTARFDARFRRQTPIGPASSSARGPRTAAAAWSKRAPRCGSTPTMGR